MELVDQFGRPLRKRDLLEEVAAPNLTGVRSIISDHPAQGLNPKRLARLLRSAEQSDAKGYLELAEEMEEKDAHYAGVLSTRKRAIRGLELHVEPVGDDERAEEAANFVRDVLEGDGVRDDLVDILDAIGKGYSCTEIIWRMDGSEWTVERLEWRDPRWFRIDQVDGRTLRLMDGEGDLDLQPWKFITHFARVKSGIPIRGGLARLAAWAYLFKNFGIKDWAIFVETYGHPIRLGKYGVDATDEDKRVLLRALRSIGADLAAALPKSMEVELVHAQNLTSGSDLYERMIRFWDEQVSKAVLGQVGTTDAIAGGHAVGRVHDQVRGEICQADADQLAATLRRDLATPLTWFNFGRDVEVPRIRFMPVDEIDLRTQVAAVRQLVPMGLRVSVSDMTARLGLQAPEDDEDLLTAPSAGAPGPEDTEDETETAASHRHEPTVLDDLVDALIDEGHAEAASAPMMSSIAAEVANASTLEELRDRLAQFADEAPPDALVGLLRRAGFAAEVAAMFGARASEEERTAR